MSFFKDALLAALPVQYPLYSSVYRARLPSGCFSLFRAHFLKGALLCVVHSEK